MTNFNIALVFLSTKLITNDIHQYTQYVEHRDKTYYVNLSKREVFQVTTFGISQGTERIPVLDKSYLLHSFQIRETNNLRMLTLEK